MVSLLLGLGNVGQRYTKTRHNVGFWVLNKLILKKRINSFSGTNEYDQAEMIIGESKILLAQPNRYMNNSGFAAKALLQLHSLTLSEMLVIVDDFNLPLGTIRIRKSGSDGGHNGLASIIEQLETDQFPRMRLGIGYVPENKDVVDYVLGEFKQQELEVVDKMIDRASEAALSVIEDGLDEAMKKYNRNPA